MTAADLIQFLRDHPKTCGVLGITFRKMGDNFAMIHKETTLDDFRHKTTYAASRVEHWLGGISTAKADEMGIETEQEGDGSYRWYYGQCFCPTDTSSTDDDIAHGGVNFPTRLHATFAAIEAALETTTDA